MQVSELGLGAVHSQQFNGDCINADSYLTLKILRQIYAWKPASEHSFYVFKRDHYHYCHENTINSNT